ncbi:MAG: hypothetical protein IKR74_02015 [Bacilli bacterium]|nr:hypothetical protein [Bacilli bacterium]
MIKKNGFISISIIYSFFIIFMLTLVLIMTSYVNTRIRLNIYKKDIKKTYAGTETYLYDYVKSKATAITRADNAKDYRYIGATVNNYVSFNGEKWRIVGAICQNTTCSARSDYYIKIVRTTTFNTPWDCKKKNVGSSASDTGSHDWSDSQLMMMLNPKDYYKSGRNGSTVLHNNYTLDGYAVKDGHNPKIVLYSQMGAYFKNTLSLYKLVATDNTGFTSNATATKCANSSSTNCLTIISEDSQGKIQAAKWVTNLIDMTKVSSSTNFDKLEKTGNYYWTGKTGLLHASDICYSYNNATNRNKCLQSNTLVAGASWLYDDTKTIDEWFLDATTDKNVLYIAANGTKFEKTTSLCSNKYIRTVMYLKNTTTVIGNQDGSSAKPLLLGE